MRVETDRLILRRWEKRDHEPFAALNADPEVMRYMTGMLSFQQSVSMIDRIDAEFDQVGFGLWAIELKETGEFAGWVGLHRVPFEAHFTPAVEVGWRLAREHWGNGYAPEGGRAALKFGFEEIGLDEIVSFTVPANLKSIAVMERLGMQRGADAEFQHPRLPDGHRLKPHVLYRLSRNHMTIPPSTVKT
jgi:RimJ/RimL family protein N-acetyltransferase